MPRQTVVVTPENIPITLELAGLGTRFGAFLIDLLIQVIFAFVLLVVGGILAAFEAVAFAGLGGTVTIALLILATFVLFFGYFIFFEAIWNGQTPGKRMFGLRVMRDGGYPVNIFSVAARNLVRIADFLPVSYAFGALAVFFNPQYKRLGDLVGGTLVIKERPGVELSAITNHAAASGQAPGMREIPPLPPGVRHPLDVLTADEMTLLRRFALRRWEMTSDDSERLAYRMVAPLVPRLGVTFVPGIAPRYADLISVLVAAADRREAEAEEG